MRSFAFLSSALSLVTLVACGGSGGGTGGATTTSHAGGSATTSATSTGGATTTSSTGGGGSGGATTTTTSSSSTGTGGSVPINACSEINALDCFSNLDCMSADRCENKGTSDLPVPCCVPGARGTGMSGDPCTIDNDCATSLCIETSSGYRCSGECKSDTECPPELPVCTKVPAILGTGSFCFPS
jgi:hypothetical protein